MHNSSWNSRNSYYKPTAYSSNSPTLNPQFKSIYTIIIIIINIIFTSPTFLFCSYLALFGLVSCSDILKHQPLHPHAGSGMRSQPGSFILVLFFFSFCFYLISQRIFSLFCFVCFVFCFDFSTESCFSVFQISEVIGNAGSSEAPVFSEHAVS